MPQRSPAPDDTSHWPGSGLAKSNKGQAPHTPRDSRRAAAPRTTTTHRAAFRMPETADAAASANNLPSRPPSLVRAMPATVPRSLDTEEVSVRHRKDQHQNRSLEILSRSNTGAVGSSVPSSWNLSGNLENTPGPDSPPESQPPAPDFAAATQPPYVRTLLFGPDGLRPGWGFAFYVVMSYFLYWLAND